MLTLIRKSPSHCIWSSRLLWVFCKDHLSDSKHSHRLLRYSRQIPEEPNSPPLRLTPSRVLDDLHPQLCELLVIHRPPAVVQRECYPILARVIEPRGDLESVDACAPAEMEDNVVEADLHLQKPPTVIIAILVPTLLSPLIVCQNSVNFTKA